MMKNSFLLKKYFACTVFALFFPLVFLSTAVYRVFLHFAKIAEAGMKGEISYLDAPDA